MKRKLFFSTLLCLLVLFTVSGKAIAEPFAPATYFVDVAKPDNSGDGLSWATAKRDIQAAINIATSGGQVWVKSGTYYPTDIPTGLTATGLNTPVSNRDKTIFLKDGVKLYGGFAGTETSISQRLIGSNTTILDGDIGTPVDSTDNCYHLMVYLGSYTTTGVTIDGFTIRNGTGATYGTSVPPYDASTITIGGIPYGITRVYGGGIYLQQGLNNVINNVVFDKNYAKNRGFGLWTDGGFGLTCSYTVTNCYFINNYGIESPYGSWATNQGKNYGYNLVFYNNKMLNFGLGDGVALFVFAGVNRFVNCSFVNNKPISGAVVNIANAAQCYFTNSLFYNNLQSPIYNPTHPVAPDFADVEFFGSFGKFTNCSMSDSAGYYNTPKHKLAPGSAGNLFLQNPSFASINSLAGLDGKYFTNDDGLALPTSSPSKNAGINDSVSVVLTKDITGANRILGTTVDIGAYEIDAVVACSTPAPSTTNQALCPGATVADLTASGTNIKWYIAATGGSPLANATLLTDGTKYYATQTISGCESPVRAVDSVIIHTTPPPATSGNLVVYTGSKTIDQLDITPLSGGVINYYYAATGGTALPGSTTVVDDTTYFITQTINGCESALRKAIKVNRIANDSSTHCAASTVANLIATPVSGNAVKWFDVPTGGTALAGTVALQSGEDTLYVEEGSVKTDTLLTRVGSYVDYIISLTHDEQDTLYYGTYGSNNVYRANPNGSSPTLLFNGGGSIRSLDYRKEGSDRFLYYLNDGTSIKKRNLASGVTTNIGSGLFWPSQIAFDDANGVIYVADRENSKLKKIVVATNTVSTVDSFITTPFVDYNRIFGVAYNPATNTIFFNNFDKGKVYSKNLSGNNPRVEILSVGQPHSISLLPNGKLLIAMGSGIVTCNQDGSSLVTLKSGLYDTNEPFYNNNGELTYTHFNSVAKETDNKSNRVAVTVIVNPVPNVIATTDKTACNNGIQPAVNFNTTTTGGTVTYKWINDNTNIGLSASGSGNIPAFTAINNSTAPVTASIIVTPTYTFGGVSCTGIEDTFFITVNPTASVNAINNQSVCNGSLIAAVNFSSPTTGGTVSYSWTNSNPSIGLAVSGNGNIPTFNAVNTTNDTISATIVVTPVFNDGTQTCTGTAQSFTILVNPSAVVNTVNNQTVCAEATNNSVNFSSPVLGTSYAWSNNRPGIGLAASGTGSVPSFVAVNTSQAAITATITVTPTSAAGCVGQPISYTITVNGLSVAPASISNPTPIVCANDAFATLSVNGGALGNGAVWKWYADSVSTNSIGTGSTLSNIAVPKTTIYFVRAEGTCNNTAAASVVVQKADLVQHVRQHWSDVLLFDNSSKNYVAWQWYKNGVAVPGANLQQYSESGSLVGSYYVVATDKNGVQSVSCPLTITAGSFTGLRISLIPNPVTIGTNLTISTSFTANELQGANIMITDVFGRVIRQLATVSPTTNIQAPTTIGMYIVTLTMKNGVKYSANLLTK